ncbi:MAG: deacetylase sulfotransferase [Acidimicrobiales bacterium]|nr:MAG: deacetylase sulfotransferase [Acidimicrobiales bacterium]
MSHLRRVVGPARRFLHRHRLLRLATAPLRPLPDFLIIGAMKSGTSALYASLSTHPKMVPTRRKELHFFDSRPDRAFGEYRVEFPTVVERLWKTGSLGTRTGEATPAYMYFPWVPELVRRHLPDVALVAVLRDPVARAFSHYHHSVRKGHETLSFEEALEAEDDRLAGPPDPAVPSSIDLHRRYSYFARGCYARQLERWNEHFPREQLLVVFHQDLVEDWEGTLRRIQDHVGLGGDPVPRIQTRPGGYPPMKPETEVELRRR